MKNRNTDKKQTGFLLLLISVLLCPAMGSAAFYDSSDLTPLNRMSLALNVNGCTTPGFYAGLAAGIGTTEWSSVHLNLGYGTDNMSTNSFYGRIIFKALISRFFGGVDKVSLSVGPVYHGHVGIYSCLMLTTTWKFIQFFTGLDDTVYFRSNETGLLFNFLIGAKMTDQLDFLRIGKTKPELILEFGIPVTDYNSYSISLGLQYKFDFKIFREKAVRSDSNF